MRSHNFSLYKNTSDYTQIAIGNIKIKRDAYGNNTRIIVGTPTNNVLKYFCRQVWLKISVLRFSGTVEWRFPFRAGCVCVCPTE